MDKIKNNKNIKEYDIKLGNKNKQYKLIMYENKKKYQTLINIIRYSKHFDTWICVYCIIVPYVDVQFYNQRWDVTGDKVLVLYSPPQGSGGFVSYIVLGLENGDIKEYVSTEMLFQGTVFFNEQSLIQGLSNQFKQWKRIGDKLLLIPYKIPEYPNALVIYYSISEEGKVEIDKKQYVTKVGKVIQFIRRDFNDITDRLLVSGKCLEFIKTATFKTTCKTEVKATIIPNGYNWDDAVEISIKVV